MLPKPNVFRHRKSGSLEDPEVPQCWYLYAAWLNQCFIRKWHIFGCWGSCSGSMLKGCTSKQVLPLPPCWWHGCVKGGVAFALILPSQGSGPFAGLLGPDMAVPDTAGLWGWAAQKSLGQRERASGLGKESQGSGQVCGNQGVWCGY